MSDVWVGILVDAFRGELSDCMSEGPTLTANLTFVSVNAALLVSPSASLLLCTPGCQTLNTVVGFLSVLSVSTEVSV